MIDLYNSSKYFSGIEIIVNMESFFKNNISASQLSQDSLDVMKQIDNAILLDKGLGTIQTPFGICNINDLSTGCKTVISAIFINEHKDKFISLRAIDATEAGPNAIELLFEYIERTNMNISVVVEHDDIFTCKDRLYRINGEYTVNSLLFMTEVEE